MPHHMKCISIDPSTISQLNQNNSWFCSICLSSILPFNHIEDDDEFRSASSNNLCSTSLSYLSDLLFSPFELNDSDHIGDLCNDDIDPDSQFF